MKIKLFQIVLILFTFVNLLQARPVTVTLEVQGGYVRTDRWQDPSTCTTFDRIVCNYQELVCYTITYTYDDGTIVNGGSGLEEGYQVPPIQVVLTDPSGQIINEGMVSFYQNYTFSEPPSLYVAYEFMFNECGN